MSNTDDKPVPFKQYYLDGDNFEEKRYLLEANHQMVQIQEQRRQHREAMKQKRILGTKEDKYLHTINVIIEHTKANKRDGKAFSIDYFNFNFEAGMNAFKIFKKFLDKLKDYGCFANYQKNSYPGKSEISFSKLNLKRLKEYKKKLEKKTTDKKKLQYEDGFLYFNNYKILISKTQDTNQHDLLRILLTNKTKLWNYDEIHLEISGNDNYNKKENWNTYDQAGRAINDKIAIKTSIQNFLKLTAKTIMIDKNLLK
jgi:hypothetical protein